MDKIINFSGEYRFAVYEHKVHKNKELSTIRMIVLKNRDGRITYYTGLVLEPGRNSQFGLNWNRQSELKRNRQQPRLVC